MMYMTGGGVQIFSVMSVWFLLKQAVTGILSVDKGASPLPLLLSSLPNPPPPHPAFAPFSRTSTDKPLDPSHPAPSFLAQKAVFVACQFGLLAVGLWKCNSMGLLPTHESDWLAFRKAVVWDDVVARGVDWDARSGYY
jgi:hypothetical protein